MLPTTGMVTLPHVFASADASNSSSFFSSKVVLGGVFVVEDLDDLLAVDRFLHEGVHVADALCCLTK